MENNADYKILVVDNEPDMLDFISYNLESQGFQVFAADNGRDAIAKAKETLPHLVLLDVMMPGMDGIEACEEMRKDEELNNMVIAFLTARGEDYSQIAGFDAGGDDYITKPIKPKVLFSRIKALLKRFGLHSQTKIDDVAWQKQQVLSPDHLSIDRERFVVNNRGEELVLPKKEFELLSLLISKPNKVFTRDEIFHEVWGDHVVVSDRTIDVHIRKLREKIGDQYIVTVKGVGYKYIE
ncbi:MAG: response regulator transcription factor [Bacteroidota bacterium]